jgi:hypothetical protein
MLRSVAIISCILVGLNVQARVPDLKSISPEKDYDQETSYRITDTSATVTSLMRKRMDWKNLMEDFLLESEEVLSAIRDLPMVTGLTLKKGEVTEAANSWSDYTIKERETYVFLNLSFPTKATLLLKATEEYRKCKPAEEKAEDEWNEWAPDAGCRLLSSVSIEGPLTVYGSFTSWKPVHDALNDKQTLNIELTHDLNAEDTELETKFSIKSMRFENGLMQFMEALNVQPHTMALERLTRHHILLGVSRVARQLNANILVEKGE